MYVAGLERMTTGSAVSALSYRAIQVDMTSASRKLVKLILHYYYYIDVMTICELFFNSLL